MKHLSISKFLILLGALVPGLALADQCVPINDFIALGKNAEKCVSEINLGKRKANDVLQHYGFCTNARGTRDDVEKRLNELPPATMNQCAERNLQAYTDAATAIQRLYQIELTLK